MQEKKTMGISKHKRMYKLVKIIKGGGFPTADDLARELKCSRILIYKYIQELNDNYNVKTKTQGRYGGYYFEDNNFKFSLDDQYLENNLEVLLSAKVLLDHFRNTPVYSAIEETLNEICQVKSDSPLLNRIALAPSVNPTQKIKPYIWKILEAALRENHIIRFHYHGNTWDPELEETLLHVHPYQFLIDEGKNLLFGYLEEKKDVRLFDLNKILELNDTYKKFRLPHDFEFKKHTGKSRFGAFTRYAPRRYKIAFYEDAIEEVKMGNWAEDQVIQEDVDEEGNKRIVISFTSSQDMKILDWVFKNKAYAKPLEPDSLVARWKFNIAVMAQMAGYNIKPDYSLLDKADKLEREGK